MPNPTIETPFRKQPTATCLTIGNLQVAFSYETPVAFRPPGEGWVVAKNIWSNTTGRTLNAIDGGTKEAKAKRLPPEEFPSALDAATRKAGL